VPDKRETESSVTAVGVADGLKSQLEASRPAMGATAEQLDAVLLAAQIRAQHTLLAEKEERIQQLTVALGEARHRRPGAPGLARGAVSPELLDAHRLAVELDETRFIAERRAEEIEALRATLIDRADKAERVAADLQAAVTRTNELRRENERLTNELAVARDELRDYKERLEAESDAARAAAHTAVEEERYRAGAMLRRPAEAAEPPALKASKLAKTPEAGVDFEDGKTETKGDQRVIVDSLLRFLGRR
jgi:hypothetical protein